MIERARAQAVRLQQRHAPHQFLFAQRLVAVGGSQVSQQVGDAEAQPDFQRGIGIAVIDRKKKWNRPGKVGRKLAKQSPFAPRFVHQPELELVEIPQPAVDQL